jgi:membrane protein DedA with SNARE-associated domain
VPIWLIVGFKFGNEIDSLLAYVQRGKEIAGAALVVIVLLYIIYIVWKAKVSSKKRVAAAEAVAKAIEAGKDVDL